MEELQVPRWIDNRIVEQSAWMYHKFSNTRDNNYAQAGLVDLDVAKTIEEEHVDIEGGVRR